MVQTDTRPLQLCHRSGLAECSAGEAVAQMEGQLYGGQEAGGRITCGIHAEVSK